MKTLLEITEVFDGSRPKPGKSLILKIKSKDDIGSVILHPNAARDLLALIDHLLVEGESRNQY